MSAIKKTHQKLLLATQPLNPSQIYSSLVIAALYWWWVGAHEYGCFVYWRLETNEMESTEKSQ
jgi:hypothetical protein